MSLERGIGLLGWLPGSHDYARLLQAWKSVPLPCRCKDGAGCTGRDGLHFSSAFMTTLSRRLTKNGSPVTAMLAEIYLLKLDAAVRAAKEAATRSTYRLPRRPNPAFHRAPRLQLRRTPPDSEQLRLLAISLAPSSTCVFQPKPEKARISVHRPEQL